MRATKPDNPRDAAGTPPRARELPIDRLFGVGEDLTAWTLPWLRCGPLRLRLHVVVLAWIAAELLAWLPHDAVGLVHVASGCTALLTLATLRELVRLAVARRLGADSDSAAVFPLGGLTPMHAPGLTRRWLVESGGLWATLVLVPLTASAVVLSGLDPHALLFNPAAPRVTAASLRTPLQIAAWWSYAASVFLLLCNLIPADPFDAGRLLRTALHARRGHAGLVLAARIGLVAAATLFIISASAAETRGMAIAAFAALATYLEFRRAEFRDDPLRPALPLPGPAPQPPTPPPALDQVLARISASGLDSLTPEERDVLAAETARRNRG